MSVDGNRHVEGQLINSEMIDFEHYWNVIRLYLWRILGLATVVTILVSLLVLSITPQYRATASLLLESEQAKVLSIEEVYGLDSTRKEFFQTQYEILKSRKIAERVVEKLNLIEEPIFDREHEVNQPSAVSNSIKSIKQVIGKLLPAPPKQASAPKTKEMILASKKRFATNKLMRMLEVTPLINTQIVEITFESANPVLAAAVANAVGDVYIESYLEAKLEVTTKATTWLNESLQGLRDKLDTSEKKLSDFYEKESLVNIDGVVGLASDKLQSLSQQLLDAQASFKRNEAIYLTVNSANANINELSNLPEVVNHPAVQSVKRSEVISESKVSELSKVYGPKHPIMIAANAELTSIRESLNKQIRSLFSGINTEYRNAEAKLADIQNQIANSEIDVRRLSTLENQSKALQREVDINQQLYDSFFTRLKETSEIGGFESANARLLDKAIEPTVPAKPKKGLIIAGSFILCFGFGMVLALVIDALNSGIRSVEDVERKLSQRMLGLIPWELNRKLKALPLRHFYDSQNHSFGESVRTLRTSLQLLNIENPAQTILVTSSVPKEGKSTVSINLAFAMGQLSKVLLIDADLRRPSIAKEFELPNFQPGLSNLISGTHSLNECIVSDDVSGIDILCAGGIPPNPQELLASKQFESLLEQFKDIYDHIIIDSAPTQAVSDAIIVAKQCDSVVYVVKADATSEKLVNNGLSRFLQTGHRVDGIVLNQVDLKKAMKTGQYPGFYDRYDYQSEPYNYENSEASKVNS